MPHYLKWKSCSELGIFRNWLNNCINKVNPLFLHDIFTVNGATYELRDTLRLQQPKVNTTTYGLNSFKYEASRLWNNLPPSFKAAHDLHIFCSMINEWPGPECSSGNCILCRINML